VGALNIGKSEMPRPPLPVVFFRVGTQDVTHPKVSEKCCMAPPKCHHVKPKCPTFFGKFVLQLFVFNNLPGLSVNFFYSPTFPGLGNPKFETGNSKLKALSSFQFRFSNFHGPGRAAPRPASCEFFAEPIGKGTWRSRGRACQGAARSLASLPHCAIPSRRHTSMRYG
jgi:hypothetical protein